LETSVYHPRLKSTEILVDNDTSDAICIGLAGIKLGKDWLEKNKVNYK
jgi:hypothetical protein